MTIRFIRIALLIDNIGAIMKEIIVKIIGIGIVVIGMVWGVLYENGSFASKKDKDAEDDKTKE